MAAHRKLKYMDKVKFTRRSNDGMCFLSQGRTALVLVEGEDKVVLAFTLPIKNYHSRLSDTGLTKNLAGFKFCREFNRQWVEARCTIIEEVN